MLNTLAVALGGSIGALLRYQVGVLVTRRGIPAYKGTFFINIVGALLIGILAAIHQRYDIAAGYALTVTGFLGGFTTFSTFAVQLVSLLRERQFKTAVQVGGFTILLGIPLAAIGFLAVQAILES
ncbi:CrcB protein [Paenibacillus phyllosphaerae]|uniref:Fluoride-specific ion channel FluC n=1 Tax=Paenibacillus phyllosphaerae TaxID=274593 RepID=A0A7W5FRD7_9BACL|nr:CrcB family protein [Paenibacillus phyllosphaerae]MBB3114415.1 CrcB protein [Paenibacillus phyllosphaerae]